MANTIALAKNYTDLLDEVYREASVTADLISDSSMMRAGANANEILYPQIEVTGLGDYNRNSGYTDGAVSLVWKTATFNYDRGTKLTVDTMDDEESFNIAFGLAGATLQREKVGPEADAFFFATLAGITGISKATPATLADGAAFLAALLAAKTEMDEDEVPEENRYLYATPTLINGVMALDTTKSREVLSGFAAIKKVPQARFYTAIDLKDGKTVGEELGHYAKHDATYVITEDVAIDSGKTYYTKAGSVYTAVASPLLANIATYYEMTSPSGKDINFMIVHKPAIIKFDKHIASDVIVPANNPDSDAYISKYRKYGLVDVYKNKVAGIYMHAKA